MTRKTSPRGTWYLVLIGVVATVLVAGLISLQPLGSPLNWFIRGMALLGYTAVFLTLVSSAHMRQVYRLFGRPFLKVHHILSVAGLILLTMHPIGVAIQNASLTVWLPRVRSLNSFLQWGGAPAWHLIGLGALAAVSRQIIGKNWRLIHILNYAAFILASVHALQIGSDFQWLGMRVLVTVLILVATVTFIQKRLQRRRRGSRNPNP